MEPYEVNGDELDGVQESVESDVLEFEDDGAVLEEEILFFDTQDYPLYFTLTPDILEMESFIGKPRKSRCWKDIVAANETILQQFVDSIKDEFKETVYIECSTDIMTYLSDKVLRSTLEAMNIVLNRDSEESTVCLYKEKRNG